MPKEDIEGLLEKAPHLQALVFRRGYLLTSQDIKIICTYWTCL